MRFRSVVPLLCAALSWGEPSLAVAAPVVSVERANLIVFAAGPTGSGKNHSLHELFTRRTPRVLSLDFTAEVRDRNPKARTVYGLGASVDLLYRITKERAPWHIAAVIEPNDVPELFHLLAPPLRSEDQTTYGRALGGLAVECGEFDLVAARGRMTPEVGGALMRSRHYGLSFYAATQRPANCDRLITSIAHVMLATGTDESIDVRWWSDRTSPAIADVIQALPQYHVAYIDRKTRCVFQLDANYKTVAVYSVNGERLSAG